MLFRKKSAYSRIQAFYDTFVGGDAFSGILSCKKCIFWKEIEVMNHFFKAAVSVVTVLLVSMAIHVFCNIRGINLESVTTTIVTASFATLIYHILIKNEKKKDDRE